MDEATKALEEWGRRKRLEVVVELSTEQAERLITDVVVESLQNQTELEVSGICPGCGNGFKGAVRGCRRVICCMCCTAHRAWFRRVWVVDRGEES